MSSSCSPFEESLSLLGSELLLALRAFTLICGVPLILSGVLAVVKEDSSSLESLIFSFESTALALAVTII